ncbi:predicted protein [Pyrenophora tritici-repentis Pt-1C-BFP]|uniref:Uncharacterized protein n=1 Tax=Pyrenophora tritici-repentis (strain Pt-1C-BFP) TaxID=426418 RepID=B2W4X6_PYRTR|nr:uncharacterized protein PTRG_04676 [Pyrenophora tritici-repentis Pt-1C-BFP]EDU47583.1 predicted protein [Pyrenophora tritici-repentis Pt-1C-BFP]
MPPTKRASDDLTRPKKRVKSSTARGTSQLRESRPEDAIVAPTEGSERVIAASSAAALDNKTLQEALDASLIDDFKGIN